MYLVRGGEKLPYPAAFRTLRNRRARLQSIVLEVK